MFKIQKDGTGFMILHEFTGKDGAESHAVLFAASDGAFYGTAARGGDIDAGTIFRLGHLLGMRKTPGAVHVEITGVPGHPYQVQRSDNLQNWSSIQSVVMPAPPRVEFDDTPAPGNAAFYRISPLRP